VTFSVVGDLIHVHPTTINLIWRAANARMTLVSDQVGEQSRTGMAPGARLAGSTSGLDAAVRNLVTKCRIPLADVLVMATERPASILRLVDRGTLRVGSRADLVVLTDDLGVRTVVCAGFSTTISGN
jgi:N-acetylglucosamine-6-phosphate deacetylase